MSANNTTYTILKGPGKFDLMNSLFTKSTYVTFTVQNQLTDEKSDLRVRINALEKEDGSAESWLMHFYIQGEDGYKKGFYRTKGNSHRGKGFIQL